MGLLTIAKQYAQGQVLTSAELTAAFQSVASYFNSPGTTGIDATNVQAGGITSGNFAAATIGTSQITNGAITTSLIATAAVGQAQRSALPQATGPSSGNFYGILAPLGAICYTTVVTTGRPVLVSLQDDGTQSPTGSFIANLVKAFFIITRTNNGVTTNVGTFFINYAYGTPVPNYVFIDSNAPAGSNYYAMNCATAQNMYVGYCLLQAYEL
jgi:hypothetical protein